jgi:hypothetical protein
MMFRLSPCRSKDRFSSLVISFDRQLSPVGQSRSHLALHIELYNESGSRRGSSSVRRSGGFHIVRRFNSWMWIIQHCQIGSHLCFRVDCFSQLSKGVTDESDYQANYQMWLFSICHVIVLCHMLFHCPRTLRPH